MKTLSIHRPRPSMLMRTSASRSIVVNACGELAALAGVEDLGNAVASQRLLQRRAASGCRSHRRTRPDWAGRSPTCAADTDRPGAAGADHSCAAAGRSASGPSSPSAAGPGGDQPHGLRAAGDVPSAGCRIKGSAEMSHRSASSAPTPHPFPAQAHNNRMNGQSRAGDIAPRSTGGGEQVRPSPASAPRSSTEGFR